MHRDPAESARVGNWQEAFVRTIGPERTDTLFAHLPPTGWGDVSTRQDVEAASAQLRAEVADTRGMLLAEIAKLSSRGDERIQAQTRWLATSMFAVVGMFVAVMLTR